MAKKLRIIYGGFWCGMMKICNRKLVHMMPKQTREKYTL